MEKALKPYRKILRIAPPATVDGGDILKVDKIFFVGVDPDEPSAANALLVDDTIIYPTAFPKTKLKLEKLGIKTVTVDADEG